MVRAALADGPKSSAQLLKLTGLTKAQLREVLYRGTGIVAQPVLYSLETNKCGVDKSEKTL